MNYINNDKTSPVLAIAFSSYEKFTSYMENNRLDMLLISETSGWDMEKIKCIENIKIVYFTEVRDRSRVKDTTCTRVYKYSKGADILKKLIEILDFSENPFKKQLYTTYAVISPLGRCGKTRAALAICNADEVRGGLYMGLESYGYMEAVTENIVYSMSDILYLAKIKSDSILDYVSKGIIRKEDIAILPSSNVCLDLKEFEAEDMEWLLDRLVEWGRYTTIVCDIDGAALNDISILGLFDKVVVPVLTDKISTEKINNFKNLLRKKELSNLADRLIEVNVPDTEYNSIDMTRYIGRILENESK
jgi:hypothetical protein